MKTIHMSKHFLPVLVNCDSTGLSDEEDKQLTDFMLKHDRIDFLSPVFDYEDLDDTDFRKCAVTGLYSDCVEVSFFGKEEVHHELN